jgi:hypothetical protein
MGTAARAFVTALAVGPWLVPPGVARALADGPPSGEVEGAPPEEPGVDEPASEPTVDEPSASEPTEDEDVAATATLPTEEDAPQVQRERVDASGGAPVGGRSRDADASDLPPDVPARMRPLQAAAWWTLFSGFAVGTTAGVLAGLATRQEDRALRLATVFETDAGRQPLYADKRDEYEAILRRGRAYQGTAIALATIAGAATITAIVLFVVDERRTKRGQTALRVHPGGIEVRF